MDGSFATPKLRAGPSSRLLKRRSEAPPPRLSEIRTQNHEATAFFDHGNTTAFHDEISVGNVTSRNLTVRLSDMSTVSAKKRDVDILESELIDGFLAVTCNDSEGFATLDQVAELEEILTHNLMLAEKKLGKVQPNEFQEMGMLLLERNTWRLVGRLFHNELMQKSADPDPGAELFSSEKGVIDWAFRTDMKLKRAQVVVDWLEGNDFKKHEDFAMPNNSVVGWENSLAAMLGKIEARDDLVTSIDPDAPRRQCKNLHELDIRDDAELTKIMFICIRAGQVEIAREMCEKAGFPWRSVVLDGWKLFHDPNYGSTGNSGQIMPVEGNKNRDLWKRTILRMTQDAKMPRYERACYAALCGNLPVLKSVCVSWDDLLWAHAKCLVDAKVEAKIRESIFTGQQAACKLPDFYWENLRSLDEVFDAVNASQIAASYPDEAKMFHSIQKCLITDDLAGLFDAIDKFSDVSPSSVTRCFAHVVIILRRLLNDESRNLGGSKCLVKYCEFLMASNHVQQVAWYVAQLDIEDQVSIYSRFLETLAYPSDKKLALALAVENGLPIRDIVSDVVARIHEREAEAGEDSEREMALAKIDALDWLLYDPSQAGEAVGRANRLIRRLKATGFESEARAAFERVPEDTSESLARSAAADSPEDADILKEHLCWRAYFEAKSAFDRWFGHFNRDRPVEPADCGPDGPRGNLTGRVAREKLMAQYNISMEQWRSTQRALASESADKLRAALTFSDGWMMSADDPELTYVRKLCIPELVMLLHSVLHSTADYAGAVGLADLVATDKHCLYESFHKENMRAFLQKVRQSAIAMLDNNKAQPDSW